VDSAYPVSYREAIAHPRFGQKWSDAVDEELRSLAENSTWDYVGLEDVLAGVTPISSKWVFKTKELPGGGIRYNARLVIRGFEQQAGVDFDETFAPVAKLQNLRMILALAAVHDWEIEQMDVVTAFLNPKVDGDVYMALPQGIEADKLQVCKLRKSLYGLKRAPRLWYEHIDHFPRSLGLQQCEYDPNVYLSASTTLTNRTDSPLAIWNSKQSAQNDAPMILLLHVDDMLLFSPSANRVTTIKHLLRAKYKMTDLGPVRCFLGIEVERDRSHGYCISTNSALLVSCLRQMVFPTATATGHHSLLEASSKDQIQSQIRQAAQQRLLPQMTSHSPSPCSANSPAPRLPSTCQQPSIHYDICDTRPTSLSSTMHQTPKPTCPPATPTQTSQEIAMTENQHLATYSCLPEALLPGVLVSSCSSLSQPWKSNT